MQNHLITRFIAVAITCAASSLLASADENGQAKKPDKPKAVEVAVDISETPELKEFADKAKELIEKWHPKIAEMLKSDGFTPPSEVTLVFKKDMRGVAHTSGKTITIAAAWIKKHPDDYGMVVHELTHVVQDYRRENRNAGWLVEGIADYVRYFKYEPNTKLGRINPDKASYRDGYGTAARFLAWIEKTHDKDIVGKLNVALRKGEYKEDLFKESTKKSLDELWADFLKAEKE
ncbi:MAG TPA: basic secretory protein-like protein [Gemmataceae bacterium]